ncbi:cytochrome-c oxidase [Sporosarcina sp. 179-K 3D1 HS]|uniref:cytochrome-c oxidase n=1 Tax=Sporosarcina sp. 179-K 3D1 HS TaxID=3232169 RepID=UPI0039A38DA1
MGKQLIKIAVVYFLIGIALGLYMSITHVFNLATVHVHINLLGWMSLAIIGILYHLYPHLAGTGSAKAHFWLHNLGLPVMMIAIALAILTANPVFFVTATIGGVITVIGIFIFGFNVLRNLT